MAAIISEKFRIFNAKQFLESLSEAEKTHMYFFVGRSNKWDAHLELFNISGTFQVGETVTFGSGGTGVVADGGVLANSLLLKNIGPTALTTPTFKTSVTGGTSGATAFSGSYRYATEEIPPAPIDNQSEKQTVYQELIAAKRITSSFARLVVPRYNWSTSLNPKFDMYRPNYAPTAGGGGTIGVQTALNDTALPGSKFYVMNGEYEVFKCIYNGENAANPTGQNVTYEPKSSPSGGQGTFANGIYTEPGGTGGYVWKHMYTLTTGDVLAFLSTDFMPIAASGEASRVAAEALAVDGGVHIVLDNAQGTTGLPADETLYTSIVGDGTGGIVKFVTTAGGGISSVEIEAAGSGYTYASVILTQATVFTDAGLTSAYGSAFTAVGGFELIISPEGGHGSDAESELFAKRVMTNIRLTYAEGSGDFPVDNDFRRIGIIQDPLDYGTNNVATDPTLRGTSAVKLNGATADYVADETITQTVTGGTAKGTVVSWDSTNGILKYFQSPQLHTDGGKVLAFESNAANAVVGGTSTASGTVDTSQQVGLLDVSFTGGLSTPEIEPNSGDIVYIENRRLITRAPDQIEDIKLVIEF